MRLSDVGVMSSAASWATGNQAFGLCAAISVMGASRSPMRRR